MISCPACGHENPDRARFCNACAAPLPADVRTPGEERKIITVVFVDLVGFTARAEELDPEDVRGLLAPYHERVRTELERFGGTVEKFVGDAVMAVFGAPTAHEDDPERAVRAALAIRDWSSEDRQALHLRIGINTGEALVALGARANEGEALAAGDVVNTAARIQAAAAEDTVLVGHRTYAATTGVIDYRAADPVVAKGKSEPVHVWEALQAHARHGVDVAQPPDAPFVGRERELDLLVSALTRAREERCAQLVTLVGVPGIGKSRLVLELFRVVQEQHELTAWRQGRSLPYGEGVTYWALGEIVKAQAGILESDSADVAAGKLRRTVADLVADEVERSWLESHLRPLVGIGGEDAGSRGGEPFDAWRRFLEAIADRHPLVLVFEDLHWADDVLLDFVDALVDRVADVPLLILATVRPELLERRPGWGGGKPNAATVSLQPLHDDGVARLLGSLLERPMLDADEQHSLLLKVGGNPLYAEQYARALSERGDLAELPANVHGVIAARIDALSTDEKRVVQDAAVAGKVFWAGALEAIAAPGRPHADEVLHRLERKQFIQRARQSSVAGEAEYAFRHVLLRDVAYGQIPRAERAEKHRRAAAWLESLGRVEDHAELLADHYVNAVEYLNVTGQGDDDVTARAQRALRDAGDRASALAAYSAAVRYYRRALELRPSDAGERAPLLLRLGRARFSAESAGAEELEASLEAFRRVGDDEGAARAALELRQTAWYEGDRVRAERWLGEALELVVGRPDSAVKAKALVDRVRMHNVAGQYAEAIRFGREALPLVEHLGLETLQVQVLYSVGVSRVQLGDVDGIADLERALAIARASNSFEHLHAAWNNLSDSQFFVGKVAEAARTYEALMDSVERFGRDVDRRWALASMAVIRTSEGRWDEAIVLADRFIAGLEGGAAHYLEAPCRAARGSIRLARADLPGARSDAERAVEAGRAAKDPQVLVPALQLRVAILSAEGERAEAEAAIDELIAFGPGIAAVVSGFGAGIVETAWLATDLGRAQDFLAVLERTAEVPWIVSARAIATGDVELAARLLAEIGCPPAEAYTRLKTAEIFATAGRSEDAARQLEAALSFYRDVRATRFLRHADAIAVRLATSASAESA